MSRRGWLLASVLALAGCAPAPAVGPLFRLALEDRAAAPLPAAVPGPAFIGSPQVVRSPEAAGSRGTAAAPTAPPPVVVVRGSGGGGSSGGGAAPAPAAAVEPHALDAIAPTSGVDADFRQLAGLALDPLGGTLYACDAARNQLRAIAPDGRGWIVAGRADGSSGYDGDQLPASASGLAGPVGLAFDPPSGALIVADRGNRRVRVCQPGGTMWTLAGGGGDAAAAVTPASAARLGEPFGVGADAQGGTWFTERDTGCVRRVGPGLALTTVATLPGGRAGALAVQAATGRAWASDDHAIWLVDPARSPALDAAPVYAPAGVRITAIAHDQRQALVVQTTTDLAPGTTGTRIWRVPLTPAGLRDAARPVTVIAGRPGTGASPADYRLPATTLPDATAQRLGGAGFCGLAIDWSRGLARPDASGLVYAGTSFDAGDPATAFAEVLRLTPRP